MKNLNTKNMNIYNLFFLLAHPQFAAIMQEPSIGRPVYIKVVRMLIETGEVSGWDILSSTILRMNLGISVPTVMYL